MPDSGRPRVGLVGPTRETDALVRRIVTACGRACVLDAGSEPRGGTSTGQVTVCRSLGELRSEVDVIVTRLPDEAALRAIAAELAATTRAAPSGQVVLDVTPVAPWTFRDLATACAAARVQVFGGAIVNGSGQRGSTLYIDSAATRMPRLRQVLEAFADRVLPIGEPGSAKAMAILAGLLVGVNAAALREALAMGRAAGIERDLLIELLGKGSGATAVMEGDAIDASDTSELCRGLVRAIDAARRVDHSVLFGALGIASLRADHAVAYAANPVGSHT